MVKPPAFSIPGTCTSSHWPGRNFFPSAFRSAKVGSGRRRYFDRSPLGVREAERFYAVIDR